MLRVETQTSGSGFVEPKAVLKGNQASKNNKNSQNIVNWFQSQNSKAELPLSSVENSKEEENLNDTQNSNGERYDKIDIAFDLSNI